MFNKLLALIDFVIGVIFTIFKQTVKTGLMIGILLAGVIVSFTYLGFLILRQ